SIKPGVPNAFGLIGDDANAIAPGKRPLSSMSPSFLRGEDRIAVLGSPGGSRIITTVLLALLNLMDGQDAQAVAAAPRFHHQYLPDRIDAENGALPEEVVAALQAMGHEVQVSDRTWGNLQVVSWDRRSGELQAGTDPRWEGVGKAGATADEASIFR